MTTLNSKILWGLFGAIFGAFMGYTICTFIAGTGDPFKIYIYDWAFNSIGNYMQTENRDMGLESLVRLLWVIAILGSAVGGASYAVWLRKRK
jgi:hypothetical protein